LNDLWKWDGLSWSEVTISGAVPVARTGHVASVTSDNLYIFGGSTFSNTSLNDLWQWNRTTGLWSDLTPIGTSPSPRQNAAMCSIGSSLYLFGGTLDFSTFFSDLWQWNGSFWSDITPLVSPPGRYNHEISAIGSDLYVFGGFGTASSIALNDLWQWNGSFWSDVTPTISPSARQNGTMNTMDSDLFLFGGYASTSVNDLWQWSSAVQTWSQLITIGGPPSARASQGMSAIKTQMYVFGGTPDSGNSAFNDLWQFSLQSIMISDVQIPAVCTGSLLPVSFYVDAINGSGKSIVSVHFNGSDYLSDLFPSGQIMSVFSAPATASDYPIIMTVYDFDFPVCSDVVTAVVHVKAPVTVQAGSDSTIFSGSSTVIGIGFALSDVSYTWIPSDGISDIHAFPTTALPLSDTTYTVIARRTDVSDCISSDLVTITVLPVPIPLALPSKTNAILQGFILVFLILYGLILLLLFFFFVEEFF
jgi:N-acetylneuraminic acid mutarotase